MTDLDLRSSFELRTYVVGSILPMGRNKMTSVKLQTALAVLLSGSGPDAKVLAMLGSEGLALRAVSWKTSSSLATHKGILALARADAVSSMYATVDPHLGCWRSARFLGLITSALEAEGISDVERSVLVGAVLSVVSQTPKHACISQGSWEEHMVNLMEETLHLDGVMVIAIPEQDKAALVEKILNTQLIASIAAETDSAKASELNDVLKSNRKRWADPGDVQRALTLISSSVLLLTGTRHIGSEKDNLLMDPATCDVSCTNDVSRRNTIVRGLAAASTLDVSLDMFTLHLGVVMAAAVRVLTKYSQLQDRAALMDTLHGELPLFDQLPYFAKTKKHLAVTPRVPAAAPHRFAPAVRATPRAPVAEDCRFARLSEELASFKVDCDARIRVLEGNQKRSRSRSPIQSPNSQAKNDGSV